MTENAVNMFSNENYLHRIIPCTYSVNNIIIIRYAETIYDYLRITQTHNFVAW